jgi:putative transposase
LNEQGKIVENFWKDIPKHYLDVSLDVFVIMPNHIHGILIIAPVGAAIGRPQEKAGNARPYSLNTIIGSYKNIASKFIHQSGLPNFQWQKSFHDHVIRKDESLDKIREYIQNNPKQWELDEENPKNIKGG